MVHGTDYGVELIIKTDRPEPLDYFSDILKISSDVRKELYKNEDTSSLTVYKLSQFEKRFSQLEHYYPYINSLHELSYNPHFRDCSREMKPKEYFYFDVNNFDKTHNVEPISSEEFIALEKKYKKYTSWVYDNSWNVNTNEEFKGVTAKQLFDELNIQYLLTNQGTTQGSRDGCPPLAFPEPLLFENEPTKSYYQNVKEMHTHLTTIELTEEEKETIAKIMAHDVFHGNKVWWEMRLATEYF